MKQRGRKSQAELSVIPTTARIERPAPPPHLTSNQAQEWIDVVDNHPADWFPPYTHTQLSAYCRHADYGIYVAKMIENTRSKKTVDVDLLDKLGKMHERETRIMLSTGTKLRITPQTMYDKTKKKTITVDPPHLG